MQAPTSFNRIEGPSQMGIEFILGHPIDEVRRQPHSKGSEGKFEPLPGGIDGVDV
jgi:hypothetical protein